MAKSITGSAKETNKGGAFEGSVSPEEIEKLEAQYANPTVAGMNFSEEERIGFAPYWNPKPGAFFMAVPVAKDERDPKFVRILLRALHDILCFSGPAEQQVPIVVKKGEEFSMSVYYALAEPFDLYIDNCDFEVPLRIQALDTVKTKEGNDCWKWKVSTTPEAKKQLEATRLKIRASLGSGKTSASLPAAV